MLICAKGSAWAGASCWADDATGLGPSPGGPAASLFICAKGFVRGGAKGFAAPGPGAGADGLDTGDVVTAPNGFDDGAVGDDAELKGFDDGDVVAANGFPDRDVVAPANGFAAADDDDDAPKGSCAAGPAANGFGADPNVMAGGAWNGSTVPAGNVREVGGWDGAVVANGLPIGDWPNDGPDAPDSLAEGAGPNPGGAEFTNGFCVVAPVPANGLTPGVGLRWAGAACFGAMFAKGFDAPAEPRFANGFEAGADLGAGAVAVGGGAADFAGADAAVVDAPAVNT